MMNEMHVVPRDAIPPIESAEQDGALHELGELRDFRWNALLRDFMPAASGFSVGWVRLKHGEVLLPQVHAVQSLMVFYAGSGTILGDLDRPVIKDEVVVIPAGCKHGFVGGPDGLHAVSILLGGGLPSPSDSAPSARDSDVAERSLNGLVVHNQKRIEEFERRALFELLGDGTLENPLKREAFLDALQVWLDGSQRLHLGARASCLDPKYASAFLDSSDGPLGSRRAGAVGPLSMHDATMTAITDWFTYQMFVLDNAEKVAVQLVIESATLAYREAAAAAFGLADSYGSSDEPRHRATLAAELLRDQSPRSDARLRCVIDEAWDMFSAMTDRVVELTREA